MVIEKQFWAYVIYHDDSIEHALQKMNKNSKRMVYCLSETGLLEGIVTDGDFRRWVTSVSEINLQLPVREISNKEYLFARDGNLQNVNKLFSSKIISVPIVNDIGRLTAIAWQADFGMHIGHRLIREDQPAFLIAEIGNNHNGCIEIAKKLVDQAAESGADCAKFQLRDMDSIYIDGGNTVSEDLGSEYTLDLLKKFQLSLDEMFEILDYTRNAGLIALCTPWDKESLKRLVEYGIEGLKISSADLTNHELVSAAADSRLPLLVSTGMSTEHEILETVELLRSKGTSFSLLQCNSTYPTPMKDINLAYMDRLREISQVPVGYSGHELGYEVCIAAVARDAKIIEKHFTLDRSMEGSDHRVSLLANEFSGMVKAIRNVEQALGTSDVRLITQGERLNREVLAKSLIAAEDIGVGAVISEAHVDVRSPGRGLQPSRLKDLVGVKSFRDMKKGDVFFESDITGRSMAPRDYLFSRPWGIPVRYHDVNQLTKGVSLDFVEIHFSYRDLELSPSDYLESESDIDFVVHSPELFAEDHVMDLSALDDEYRQKSIAELQRVIDKTRDLKRFYPKTNTPMIVVNAGGFTSDGFIAVDQRHDYYERIGSALSEIDSDGVEIIIQTMPPFPWHFGGQAYHNLFLDPEEIVAFCKKYKARICLDISHSKLACNYFGWSMREFIRKVGSYTAHLHIVDARGDHDEGLQIDEGEIDFEALGEDLDRWIPNVPFIPEIWQGHKNAGEGFWIALDRLEKRFKVDKS
jgi:sialic acid synthase SpsE/sugar phosphate isomerase/epimerase